MTTNFHSSKSSFFLLFTRPELIHCEEPKIKGATWPKIGHFRAQEGFNLDQIKKKMYGVYWNQYQGFKAPAFWLNVLFQNVAPP
jgi:hypothetical protein